MGVITALPSMLQRRRIVLPHYNRVDGYPSAIPITVSGLAATAGLGQVTLTWSYSDTNQLGSFQIAAVEVWAAKSNDRTGAAHYGDAASPFTSFGHIVAPQSGLFYYWIRARDASGNLGPWSADATHGVIGAPYGVGLPAELLAWTAFTPVVVPAAGVINSYTAACQYKTIGKTCLIAYQIYVPDNGTGTGHLIVDLPFLPNGQCVLVGWNTNSTSGVGGIYDLANYTGAKISIYKTGDGSYPVQSGHHLFLNGSYETV